MCCGKFYPDNNHPGAWIYPAWSWSLTGNISLLWDLFLTCSPQHFIARAFMSAVKSDLKWPWPPRFYSWVRMCSMQDGAEKWNTQWVTTMAGIMKKD